ncbi:unnamed protein product [Effrenium voratum]|uniref:Secreted protein n=1 Tax=Effrenium voratum TaxID=2562239 RepID=A0AA36I2I5_9DINO|nr:unnamed protein product [Effrenium voratum]CAJ1448239.1 unnamed protein product [Effrenium voratum]
MIAFRAFLNLSMLQVLVSADPLPQVDALSKNGSSGQPYEPRATQGALDRRWGTAMVGAGHVKLRKRCWAFTLCVAAGARGHVMPERVRLGESWPQRLRDPAEAEMVEAQSRGGRSSQPCS